MRCLWLFPLLVALAIAKKSYEGYKVVRVYPENDHQLEYLAKLQASDHYDFWTEIRRDFIDIMVAPHEESMFRAELHFNQLKSSVIIENVEDLIGKSNEEHEHVPKEVDWDTYHRLADIHVWLDELAEANPEWVSTEIIGESYLGNDMKIIKINTANSAKKFWLDGGIHAREWIGDAFVTYAIDQLINNYEENKELVDAYDWYILPVHNPDGYEYSHTDDRLWRKTLTDHNDPDFGCVGVDPNRNWDFHWMEFGSDQDKCSFIYAGPEPFSEKCCTTVRDYVADLNADGSVLAYYTIHSYGQVWLCPWGWTEELPPNYDDLERVAMKGIDALTALYGTEYEFGTATNIFYLASGASDDYAYGVHGIPFVYTLELRDLGEFGFVLPEEQILPTVQETFAGFKASALEILEIQK